MTESQTDELLLPRVAKAFSRAFGRDVPFRPDLDRAHEQRWTSLKHVEFLIALEGEFKVRFDGADATDLTSIPAVLARLRTLTS
jgi:acyl carrier protein